MARSRGNAAEKDFTLQRVLICCFVIVLGETVQGTGEEACVCTVVTNVTAFQTAPDPGACCLNFTGLPLELLDWNLFSGVAALREVDLSNCSISHIDNVELIPRTLEILHLNDNHLEKLPADFLKNAGSFKRLHLENNRLAALPKTFLQASDQIQEVFLDFNDLTSIPPGVFKPSLVRLGFSNNSLECTCSLYNTVEKYLSDNSSNEVLGDLNCITPKSVHGINIQQIKKGTLCRSHRLTALFICLPLMFLLGISCWCFCCRQKKDTITVGRQQCHLATVERNGCKNLMENHQYIPCDLSLPAEKNETARNKILMKPSTALLGSSRDLYEEVEIKLGTSADSLEENDRVLYKEIPKIKKTSMEEEAEEKEDEEEVDVAAGSELDAETVSVTEVLKNSTDREKLYMNQSTDYYNLVPAIELDDSDHFEYENVDLH